MADSARAWYAFQRRTRNSAFSCKSGDPKYRHTQSKSAAYRYLFVSESSLCVSGQVPAADAANLDSVSDRNGASGSGRRRRVRALGPDLQLMARSQPRLSLHSLVLVSASAISTKNRKLPGYRDARNGPGARVAALIACRPLSRGRMAAQRGARSADQEAGLRCARATPRRSRPLTALSDAGKGPDPACRRQAYCCD